MKPLIPLLLALLSALTAFPAETETPHVTVFGTAVSQVQPDLLRWQLTISDEGVDLPALAEAHSAHTTALIKLLVSKGIPLAETQTSGMRFAEKTHFAKGSRAKDGYRATTQVSFTMRNPADYRAMWLSLAEQASVSVETVSWDSSDRINVQHATRLDALRNAREKAEQMAKALGEKIAEPFAIEEVLVENPWSAASMMVNSTRVAEREDDSGEAVAPGSVSIRVRVRVVFQLARPLTGAQR